MYQKFQVWQLKQLKMPSNINTRILKRNINFCPLYGSSLYLGYEDIMNRSEINEKAKGQAVITSFCYISDYLALWGITLHFLNYILNSYNTNFIVWHVIWIMKTVSLWSGIWVSLCFKNNVKRKEKMIKNEEDSQNLERDLQKQAWYV